MKHNANNWRSQCPVKNSAIHICLCTILDRVNVKLKNNHVFGQLNSQCFLIKVTKFDYL